MKMINLILLIITIGCSFKSIGNETKQSKEVARQMVNDLSTPDGPGLQYVLVNKEAIVFEHSAGKADIRQKTALTLDHTMAAFSMTKTITAIALLQLTEQNKIDLDDKVSAYVDHPYDSRITIRHLITHTAGIPNPIPFKWVHLAENHDSFDKQKELIQVLQEHPTAKTKPGSKYQYSNIGYWLLGQVIEKASGYSYTDYMTLMIFEPLALTTAEIGFLIPNTDNQAKGYLKKWSLMNLFGRFFIDKSVLGDYEGDWLQIKHVYLNGPSFGGAIGSAMAFSRILQDLLSEHSRLLGPSARQLLFSRQRLESGEEIDMTLGWHIGQHKDATYYFKEGGGPGFRCEMRIYPQYGLASVLMTNQTSFNPGKHLNELDHNFITQ